MAAGLAIGVSLLTLVPYLVARQAAPPGWVFSGFLVNPYDGFSYLAKMRQGFEGSWLFVLPYAADPGRPTYLFGFYLALGHFARLSGVPLVTAFHVSRVLAGSVMYLAVYALLERLPLRRAARWSAYALVLGISGLGWLGVAAGVAASDLLIPESVPWVAILVNPHFPLAAAALTLGFLAALTPASRWTAAGLAGAAGLVLGIVQPFVLATLWSVLGSWAVVEMLLGRGGQRVVRPERGAAIALGASALTGLPWVVYDAWLVTSHPALRQWSLQNLTLSPSPIAYLIGFGPLLAWVGLSLIRARPLREPPLRLIALWAGLGFLLLYLPFGLQRRLTLGLAIPLVALAGLAIDQVCSTPARRRLAVLGTLLLTLPSLLLVTAAGVSAAASPSSSTVLSQPEVEAYTWMAAHLPADSLVLAAEPTGNRIPAYLNARVLAGHPFETPNAAQQRTWIAQAFGWSGDPEDGLRFLAQRGVEFVYRGREEAALGDPTWLAVLTPVFTSGEVSVYSVKH